MSKEFVFLLLLLSGFFAVVGLAGLCIRYRLQMRNLRRRLALTETRLHDYRQRLEVLRGRPAAGPDGGDGGNQGGWPGTAVPAGGEAPHADLRLRLQRGQQGSSSIVERYRLVGNMVQRGLSAEDISAILQLPKGETEQLLKLAQVGRLES